MEKIGNIDYSHLPDKGYLVDKERSKQKFYEEESHIHEQNPFSAIRATSHKLSHDIFTYFPKGFKGSKNSDFYEYLSLGMIPYLIGSAMLIASYGLSNGRFNSPDKAKANQMLNKMGAGVILYGLFKSITKKISHALIHHSTGINLDLRYKNKRNELPEPGQEKGDKREQYPKVFDSADFPRKDLIAKDSELNHENLYHYEDQIAKKAGYNKELNAPNQVIWPKIREVKVRTTALENVNQYIAAATGVALGAQKAFAEMNLKQATNQVRNAVKNKVNAKPLIDIPKALIKATGNIIKTLATTLKDSAVQLWNGSERNKITKHFGKALIIATGVSTLLTWLIPTLHFKKKPDTMKSTVDTKKEYEVC